MPALASILFGAAFPLVTAYALGVILLRRIPVPPEIALAAGAVVESALVFVLLLAGAGYWGVFLTMGLAAIAVLIRIRRTGIAEPAHAPGKWRMAAAAVFGAYGLWYFVNALAPETAADGVTYHLGLAYEYARLARFPQRIAFYDMVPRGMEMLYTVAFAFGRHSAAKLVELGFFLASLPLIFRVGRRLGLSAEASLAAAVFYFCSPVAGITGSSSYNEGAGVFFLLAAFYLMLVWRDTSDRRYLLPAGMLAGFCYAIKLPGVAVAALAVLFALWRRRWRDAALVAAGAALVMAPWMVRNAALTGNPVAPLMNGLFPNPYFHLATERSLARDLRSLGSWTPAQAWWELAFGGGLGGSFGPLLLALPLGLLAVRRREGRLCWMAAVVLALPWLTNTGARFLMPSLVIAALGSAVALRGPKGAWAAWAAIGLQAVLCWPQVIDLYETRYAFRLHEFPLRAALRMVPEEEYLKKHVEGYDAAKTIERVTPPGARTLALLDVAKAYLDRDAAVYWQSAEADRMLDTLRLAADYPGATLYDWKAEWPAERLRAVRFRLPADCACECDIDEAQLFDGADRVSNGGRWTLRAWPNRWELPLILDGNVATRWRTWEPVRAGMFVEIELDGPRSLSAAGLLSHAPVFQVPLEVYGQVPDGGWRLLSKAPAATALAPEDLRRKAMDALRGAGFRYLLAPTGEGGNAPIGNAIVGKEQEWGVERVAQSGRVYLWAVSGK